MRTLWALIACGLLLLGCRKSDEVDPIPVLTFESISEADVVQFENLVTLTLGYTDQDGDLGEEDPDALSLRIKDDRLEDYDWYHIPPLTPCLDDLNISGTFEVELPPLFLLGSGSSEATRFTVQIRDRAGNWSNPVQSPEVVIHE